MPRGPLHFTLPLLALLGFEAPPTDADPAPSATLEVVLEEGTNMAVALSPDGSTLALDLVGRIWTIPAAGGVAQALTDPFGDARQPDWSPDGSRVAFQAYWAGDYDIWVVNADGSALEQVTHGPFDDREPAWSPDGSSIIFASDRGGSYDIWEVVVASGETRQLTNGSDNAYTPDYSPDGTSFAYVTDGTEAGVWTRGSNGEARRVVDLDGAEGYAPAWSAEGDRLAYVRITQGTAALHLKSLDDSGDDLGDLITGDQEDVFPFRPQWEGNGRLLYTSDGRVRSRASDGDAVRDIPFRATVELQRPTYRKKLRTFDDQGERPVRGIVSPSLSPDGRSIVFAALGDLWTMEIGNAPERLTDDVFVEVDPMWSPDGSLIVYASDREGGTDLYLRTVATGDERKLTDDGGAMPAWSPDGTEIAYTGGAGPTAGLRVVSVGTGELRTVRTGLNSPGRPTWSLDGESIAVSALWRYSTRYREGVNRPLLLPATRPISQELDEEATASSSGQGWHVEAHAMSGDVGVPGPVRLQVGERWLDFAPHGSFASRGTDGPVWSPDGKSMAYVASGVLWTIPVAPSGDPVGPAVRLNNERSADPSWSGDSRSILYMTTDRLRRVWVESGLVEDVPIPLTWSRATPEGRFVLHAGRLFDGVTPTLREDVDIIVDADRIVRVADHSDELHAGRVVDASDGVVSPGLIEMHMHGGLGAGEHVGRQWLAYGVTTVRTPSADPYEMVEARESDANGRRLGPRLFGTGNTIDGSRIYYAGAPALTSSGQVELEMAQARDLDFDLIKTYVRLSDPVQQRVIEGAHEMGLPVTSHELYPGVAYGADGVEHVKGTSRRGYSTKVSELNRSYQDVVELLARSGMTLTPTVGIYGGYGLLATEDPSLLQDGRIQAFMPWAAEAGGGSGSLDVRRRLVSDMAGLARRVLEGGGTVVVGTDAPINPPGLSLIAEMQILVDYGDMSPADVMRATTSVSAEAMGYGRDLGAVRSGMLADLVVFGDDPLTDIRAVRDVRLVVEGGRVHTLDELMQGPGR